MNSYRLALIVCLAVQSVIARDNAAAQFIQRGYTRTGNAVTDPESPQCNYVMNQTCTALDTDLVGSGDTCIDGVTLSEMLMSETPPNEAICMGPCCPRQGPMKTINCQTFCADKYGNNHTGVCLTFEKFCYQAVIPANHFGPERDGINSAACNCFIPEVPVATMTPIPTASLEPTPEPSSYPTTWPTPDAPTSYPTSSPTPDVTYMPTGTPSLEQPTYPPSGTPTP